MKYYAYQIADDAGYVMHVDRHLHRELWALAKEVWAHIQYRTWIDGFWFGIVQGDDIDSAIDAVRGRA